MKADGWEDELEANGAREVLRAHKLVNQPKELTDRGTCRATTVIFVLLTLWKIGWETIKSRLAEFLSEFGRVDVDAAVSVTCV